jgi:hypothetical protein
VTGLITSTGAIMPPNEFATLTKEANNSFKIDLFS